MDLYQFYQINFYMYILKYLQHRKTVSQFWVEKTGWLWHVLKRNAFSKGVIMRKKAIKYNAFQKRRNNANKDVITPS